MKGLERYQRSCKQDMVFFQRVFYQGTDRQVRLQAWRKLRGTQRKTDSMRNAAVKAGAKFIVSPGFDPEIVNYCLEKRNSDFPGMCDIV